MDAEITGLLTRGVAALERLAEDPVIEMEVGPPVCPFCERINPSIRVEESRSTGPMAEFVVRALCQHCNNVFYSVPLQWGSRKTVDEIRDVVSERMNASGNGRNEH
jgi:hypothetical protein